MSQAIVLCQQTCMFHNTMTVTQAPTATPVHKSDTTSLQDGDEVHKVDPTDRQPASVKANGDALPACCGSQKHVKRCTKKHWKGLRTAA